VTNRSGGDRRAGEEGYHQRLAAELGAQLTRALERQASAHREALRCRAVARLIREMYCVGEGHPSDDDVAGPFLQAVLEHMFCDRAALFREEPRGSRQFSLVQALGTGKILSEIIFDYELPPDFLLICEGSNPSNISATLTAAMDAPRLLWARDRATGLALVIASKSEQVLGRPFEAADQELVEGVLAVYVDTLRRKRAELLLWQAKQGAEERDRGRLEFLQTIVGQFESYVERLSSITAEAHAVSQTRAGEPISDAFAEAGLIAAALARIILDCKQILRNERVPMELEQTWIDIELLLKESVRSVYAQSIKSRVDVSLSYSGRRLEVYADRTWLCVILDTLLAEAVRSSQPGTGVQIAAKRKSDGAIEVEVTGDRQSDLERCTSEFVHQQKSQIETLIVTRRLVEAHGAVLTFGQNAASDHKIALIFAARDCYDGGKTSYDS
jgi:hypothetical protein